MLREEGYYWVKMDDEWIIVHYIKKHNMWTTTGYDGRLDEGDFSEVKENRILNPDET